MSDETPNPSLQLYSELTSRLPKASMWFPRSRCLSLDDHTLTIRHSNQFIKEWIGDHYLQTLSDLAAEQNHPYNRVVFVEDKSLAEEIAAARLKAEQIPTQTSFIQKPQQDTQEVMRRQWIPETQYSNLLVVESNKEAHQAANDLLTDSLSGRVSSKPVCFVGKPGLGKTTLLGAISHHLITHNRTPGYVDVSVFSETYAKTRKVLDTTYLFDARDKSRVLSFLAIDNLQAVLNTNTKSPEYTQRPGCQNLVLRLLEYAAARRKNIALASTVDPRALAEKVANETLASKLQGFDVVEILPLKDDRRIYLTSLLAKNFPSQSRESLEQLAGYLEIIQPTATPRAIDSHLISIARYFRAHSELPNPNHLTRIIGAQKPTLWDNQSNSPEQIVEVLSRKLFPDLDLYKIRGKSRKEDFVHARHTLIWALHQLRPDLPPERISIVFGRDRSTVYNSLEQANQFLTQEKQEEILKMSKLLGF